MLWFGTVLCALGGMLLAALALPGKPTRGENLIGAHLYTAPLALAFTIGALCVLLGAPLPHPAASWVLGLSLPGLLPAMTLLPLAAHGHRHALLAKAAVLLVVLAPFALGHGGNLHAALPWLGAGVLVLVAAAGLWGVFGSWLRRRLARWTAGLRRRAPSAFEVEQGDWQRRQWLAVPPVASVEVLLGHARALAPDVRTACQQRLLAHPDLEAGLAAALRGPEPGAALWYLRHCYPRAKAPFAAPLVELLAGMRRTWPERLRADSHPRPWTGDLLPALECAVAVLREGGEVRDELLAWQGELAALPPFAELAQDLERELARAAR